LVERYFIDYARALLRSWLIIGAFAVGAGCLMALAGSDVLSLVWVLVFAVVSYLAHRFWIHHPRSASLLWLVVGVSAVIVVAAAAQLSGLFTVQRYELRSSLLWLLCLAAVDIINPVYGAATRLILRRPRRTEFEQAVRE
jgi:hypothetical protein